VQYVTAFFLSFQVSIAYSFSDRSWDVLPASFRARLLRRHRNLDTKAAPENMKEKIGAIGIQNEPPFWLLFCAPVERERIDREDRCMAFDSAKLVVVNIRKH